MQESQNSDWNLLNTPEAQEICERMLGFSLPVKHQLVIISYEGIHVINLQRPEDVQHEYDYPEGGDIYRRKEQVLEFQGNKFQIVGVFGGSPILHSQRDEQLTLTSTKIMPGQSKITTRIIQVKKEKGFVSFEFPFEDLSGDWAYASFSADSNYIVVGAPYNFYVFQRNE